MYYLMKNAECIDFVASDSFKKQFDTILQHDRAMFEEPTGWQNKLITESPFVNDFSNCHIFLKPEFHFEQKIYVPVPKINKEKCISCGKCAEI